MRTRAGYSLFAMFMVIALLLPTNGQASAWRTIRPLKGGKKITLVIDGSKRTYFRLDKGQQMEFKAEKGADFRIYTRVDLRKKKSKEAVYTFRAGYNQHSTRLFARASTPDKSVLLKGKPSVVGKARSIRLSPPEDAQTLVIKMTPNTDDPVFFRVQRERSEIINNDEFVTLTPDAYKKTVTVSVRENLSTYYFVDAEKNLNLTVNGPATVKILARVMMDDSMKGKIKFPLAVYQDAKKLHTYQIETNASEVAILPDYKDMRPTRGDAFYIHVPEGRHRYNFELPANHNKAILRFFIHEKDLKKRAG